MLLHLKVTYNDGREVDAEANYVDVISFERHFGVSSAGIFSEVSDGRGGILWDYDENGNKTTPKLAARAEYLAYLAYAYEQRVNGETAEFDTWLNTVSNVRWEPVPKAGSSRKTRKRSASPPSQ